MIDAAHRDVILDQFTRQAIPFATDRQLPRVTGYRLEGELEGLIARSFPDPGDDETLRRRFRASIARDDLDMGVRKVEGRIRFGYPVAVLVAGRD